MTTWMTEDDYYSEAVLSRDKSDKSLKHFALCCANVSGSRTADLAADCECSVATIEIYRNVYKLYYEMGVNIESEHVQKLWRDVKIDLWRQAVKHKSRYNLTYQQVMDYLIDGKGMSRESFSAHIDEKENDTPKWIRRLQHAIKFLRPSRNDYKSEMPPHVQKRYDEAVEVFVSELEQIAALADEVKE